MKNNLIKSLILSGCLAMTIVSCERKELSEGGLLLSDSWKVQSSAKISLPGEEVSNSQIAFYCDGDINPEWNIYGCIGRNKL